MTKLSLSPSRKKFIVYLILVLIFFTLAAIIIYLKTQPSTDTDLSFSNKRLFTKTKSNQHPPSPSPTLKPSPSPTPIPLVKGKETYTISQANSAGPRILSATIDPLDPNPGQTQTFNLKLKHSQPIDLVEVTLVTDNAKKTKTLTLSQGTNQEGVWTTTFNSTDTHLYNYAFAVKATSNNQTSSITLTIR